MHPDWLYFDPSLLDEEVVMVPFIPANWKVMAAGGLHKEINYVHDVKLMGTRNSVPQHVYDAVEELIHVGRLSNTSSYKITSWAIHPHPNATEVQIASNGEIWEFMVTPSLQ